MHGAFEFEDFPRFEQPCVAGGNKGFAPQHDLRAAGEVFDDQHAEGFAGLGDLGIHGADHAGEGESVARIGNVQLVQQPEALVAVGIDHAAELVERMTGDVET